MALDRIVVDHQIMGGVPCVRGTRIPVATVVGLVAQGLTNADIRADYPQLADEDIGASLEFAAEAELGLLGATTVASIMIDPQRERGVLHRARTDTTGPRR